MPALQSMHLKKEKRVHVWARLGVFKIGEPCRDGEKERGKGKWQAGKGREGGREEEERREVR